MQAYQRPTHFDTSWGPFFYFAQGVSGERKVTGGTGSAGITPIQIDNANTGSLYSDRITWNLHSANNIYNGTQVTPLSKSCKFFIRYL